MTSLVFVYFCWTSANKAKRSREIFANHPYWEAYCDDERAAQGRYLLLVISALALGSYFYYRFWRARQKARRDMKLAKAAYDEVWRKLRGQGGIDRLNGDFDRAVGAWEDQAQSFKAESTCELATAFGRLIGIHPANDFVELFKQAHGVRRKLLQNAGRWARKHRGTREGGGVKDPKRALQKTFRSYGGDSRKLCDLARTTIVFDSFDNMADCLQAIIKSGLPMYRKISDKEQNRFHPRYTKEKGNVDGYRDMQLRIGIDGHVCEIQMHIRPMHKLKNDEAHSKYKKFRDLTAK